MLVQDQSPAGVVGRISIFDCMQVDMLVGDIYGDRDYSSIGLSASTIASSFGKVVSQVSSLR